MKTLFAWAVVGLILGNSHLCFAGNGTNVLKGEAQSYLAASSSELADAKFYGSVNHEIYKYVCWYTPYGKLANYACVWQSLGEYSAYTAEDELAIPKVMAVDPEFGSPVTPKVEDRFHNPDSKGIQKINNLIHERALKICRAKGFTLPAPIEFQTIEAAQPYAVDYLSSDPSVANYYEEQIRQIPKLSSWCCSSEYSAVRAPIKNLVFKKLYCVK